MRWQNHAAERMIERSITSDDVKNVILYGSIIEKYQDDKPFPSYLVFSIIDSRPLHVVCSYDNELKMLYIITTYEPDSRVFNDDHTTRRKQ